MPAAEVRHGKSMARRETLGESKFLLSSYDRVKCVDGGKNKVEVQGCWWASSLGINWKHI